MATIYKREQNGKADSAYSVTIRTHTGRRARLALFPDKGASQTAANCVERLVDLRAAGREPGGELLNFIDHCGGRLRARLAALGIIGTGTAAAAKPLPELIAEWDATRRSRSATSQKQSAGRALKICKGCGFHSLNEINAGAVNRYLEAMGKSARTYNLYLANIRTFLNWCVKSGLLAANPLRALTAKDTATDRRRERRALTPDEIARLLAATEAGGQIVHGLAAHERALVYWLAVVAGARLNEIHTLQRNALHLEGERPYITLEGTNTKNGKTESVAITPELAAALAEHMAAAPALPCARLFPRWAKSGAAMLRLDLEAAGIPYRDESGRVVDFHALRHTCGTLLLKNGVSLAVAQRQMRHSTPILTANTYGHIELIDKAAAVRRLPRLAIAAAGAAKTGTNDAGEMAESLGNSLGNRMGDEMALLGPMGNFDEAGADGEETTKKPGKNGVFPGLDGWLPRRDSNPQKQNQNLMSHAGNHAGNQPLAGTATGDRQQDRQQAGANAPAGTATEPAPARPLQAIGQTPPPAMADAGAAIDRAGAEVTPAPDGLTPAGAEPSTATRNAPGTRPDATEPDAGGLAGVVAVLRGELAAQREENARLRETLAALTSTLARLAGADGAGAGERMGKD